MTHPGAQHLAELEASAKNATPGEWSIEKHGNGFALYAGRGPMMHGLNLINMVEPDRNWPANAAHIANASPARIAAIAEYVNGLEAAAADPNQGLWRYWNDKAVACVASLAAEKARADAAEAERDALRLKASDLTMANFVLSEVAAGNMPERIWAERDGETNEKRWFSIKGMGVEYVRAERAEATIASLTEQLAEAREAFHRQADSMAFVINNVGLPDQWRDKFMRELDEDRSTLSRLGKNEGGERG